MNEITQRVTRVVSQRVTDIAVEKVTRKLSNADPEEIREARRAEKEAQARALARAAASAPERSPPRVASSEGIDALIEDEDCPVCASILTAVRDMDEPRRTQGVAEYGEFRRAIEESEEAAEEVLDDSEVLVDALGDVSGVTP